MGFSTADCAGCMRAFPKTFDLEQLTERLLQEKKSPLPKDFERLQKEYGNVCAAAVAARVLDDHMIESELERLRDERKIGSKSDIPRNIFLSAIEFASERLRHFKK